MGTVRVAQSASRDVHKRARCAHTTERRSLREPGSRVCGARRSAEAPQRCAPQRTDLRPGEPPLNLRPSANSTAHGALSGGGSALAPRVLPPGSTPGHRVCGGGPLAQVAKTRRDGGNRHQRSRCPGVRTAADRRGASVARAQRGRLINEA